MYQDSSYDMRLRKRKRKKKRNSGKIILVILILLALAAACIFFLRKILWNDEAEKAKIDEKTAAVTDTSGTAYFDAGGNRVINWENITIPDWITRDLLPKNEYSRPGIDISDVNGIVVHYTANPGSTAEQNRNYFANLADGSEGRYASSHFIIGIDGTIIQCIPLSEISYASNDRNYDTISIECCHEDETGAFTKETYNSLVKLTAWLSDTFLIQTDNIIRHYDVTGKICPKYFVDHEDAWEEFKMDVVKKRQL